jgi:hypothetical protein
MLRHAELENTVRSRSFERLTPEQQDHYRREAASVMPDAQVARQSCARCHQQPDFDLEQALSQVSHKGLGQTTEEQ